MFKPQEQSGFSSGFRSENYVWIYDNAKLSQLKVH